MPLYKNMDMKPLGRKNYGSIPHISGSKLGPGDHYIHEGQERILTEKRRDQYDEIIITEKYDGSNVGVCRKNGEILALTRSGYLASTSPYKQHHLFAEWVEQNRTRFRFIGEGERIVGEWLAQAHGLKYKIHVPHPIVFFDLFRSDNTRVSFLSLLNLCAIHGLVSPRILNEDGVPKPIDSLILELNKGDMMFEAEDKPEGMVFRCERKGQFDFMAKWVRDDFQTGQYIIGIEEGEEVWNI